MWRQESTQRNAPPGLRPQTPRVSALRFPAALETRGLPAVASPFAGASDHRTLAFSRLTPRPSVYLRGSAEGPLFAPAFPASLERPVRTVRGAPARRGGDSLDPRLSPARPCPCGGRGACCASLSLLLLASPGLAVRGEPVQRVKRSLDLCLDPLHPSPAPYGPALRLHSGLGLTKGAQKKYFTSNHSRLTCVGLGVGCAPHSA